MNNVGVTALENPGRERWQSICEQIAQERDSDRLMRLIEELNQLLQAREQRAGSIRSKAENVSTKDPDAERHAS
jgi:hypothetical protein